MRFLRFLRRFADFINEAKKNAKSDSANISAPNSAANPANRPAVNVAINPANRQAKNTAKTPAKDTANHPLKMQNHKSRNLALFLRILAICAVFIINILVLSYLWIINHYNSDLTFEVVLFHLRFPLVGTNSEFIYSYILQVVLPSVGISVVFALKPTMAVILGLIFSVFILYLQDILKVAMIVAYQHNNTAFEMLVIFLKGAYFGSFLFTQEIGIVYVLKLLLLILGILAVIAGLFYLCKVRIKAKFLAIMLVLILAINCYSINSHFHITRLLVERQYGDFYETHYKLQDYNAMQRNLIVIFVESLESSFDKSAFLNLYNLATQNISFSHNDGIGGHFQKGATSWTIAGIIGYLCGIPLNAPGGIDVKDFLAGATCISDILNAQGYKQMMIMGSDDSFAAKGAFLKTHKIESKDARFYKNQLPQDYTHHWGFSDSYLFDFAKQELEILGKSNKPFALYLLTNNTHSPDFYVESFCDKEANRYYDALKCSDRMIYDFIAWVKEQDFYSDTSIVILGDHLLNTHSIKQNRFVYNAFINARFSAKLDSAKNRALSHFDFAPLILDSLGGGQKIAFLGLGVNPLYAQTLLEIYGDLFEAKLREDSKLYESFWRK